MADDNIAAQKEEVEALSAIYGDDWCMIDDISKTYCIRVVAESAARLVSLEVHMPDTYPASSPPEYRLNAPWLRGEERKNIQSSLEEIYWCILLWKCLRWASNCIASLSPISSVPTQWPGFESYGHVEKFDSENIGECIIHLWVEKVREYLQGEAEEKPQIEVGEVGRVVTFSTETDHGDKEIDLEVLGVDLENMTTMSVTDAAEENDWELPHITHGDTVTDRRSIFQPHLAPVFHPKQVKMVMNKLVENKKIANATHRILAYRISMDEKKSVFNQGCEDDGEIHAGSRMLHLLQILDAKNVMVVVTRWYGGIHLGPDRFKHINNCTRLILKECGYLKEKEVHKGPKSSDKKKR